MTPDITILPVYVSSHVYVCIVAGRYGSGITEAEYDRASDIGLPRLIYFKDDTTLPDEWRGTDPAQLTPLVVEGVLIGLLLSARRRAGGAADAVRPTEQTTRELEGARAHALPEPVPSVTEHTTRTFEPVYSGRKAK